MDSDRELVQVTYPTPGERVPLTDEQLDALWRQWCEGPVGVQGSGTLLSLLQEAAAKVIGPLITALRASRAEALQYVEDWQAVARQRDELQRRIDQALAEVDSDRRCVDMRFERVRRVRAALTGTKTAEPGESNTPPDQGPPAQRQLEDDASYLTAVAAFLRALGRAEAADRLNGIAAAIIVMPADQWTAARRFFG